MTRYSCEYAWLGGATVTPWVTVDVEGDRIVAVSTGAAPSRGSTVLAGVTVPGLANAHSHAFHRALRSRTQTGSGSFWTWRQQMYRVASMLDPDSYFRLARATYAEMALAGVTCVGEFHYVHHRGDGGGYDDANAMGAALIAAAASVGVRLTLLDACYVEGGPGQPLAGAQLRFGDGDADRWAERASARVASPHVRLGAAIHSLRAVPPDQAAVVAAWAADRDAPLHFHLSEQPAENDACREAYGHSPTELLAGAGALGPASTAVHATHLTAGDRRLLGTSATGVCMCPTTERDLADGIGPARELADLGAPISLGSDSHAVIDLFCEARAMELDERLARQRRGHWSAAELLASATSAGNAALGWSDAGRIEVGAIADLVTVTRRSPRLAGAGPEHLVEAVVFAANAADVREVISSGRHIVADGCHLLVDDVEGELDASIAAVCAQ